MKISDFRPQMEKNPSARATLYFCAYRRQKVEHTNKKQNTY